MEETRVLVRTSERSTFKECRQKWWWAYVEHLRKIRVSSPLFFGDLVHRSLEAWYIPGKKRGVHPAVTFSALWGEWLANGGEEVMVGEHSAGDLGVEMLKNYVDFYGNDEHLEVIAPEMKFQVDVEDSKGNYLFTYVGTCDGVVRDLTTMKIGILEHKTGASLEPFGAPLPLDDQNGAYWTFLPFQLWEDEILPHGQWPDFMLYNRLRKAPADQRPKNSMGQALNKNGSVSKVQPAPLFRREFIMRTNGDRRNVMRSAKAEAREMGLVKNRKLQVYKHPGKHCGYCEFREMCEVHETGSDWKALRDNMYVTWNPYDEHEIQLEGKT